VPSNCRTEQNRTEQNRTEQKRSTEGERLDASTMQPDTELFCSSSQGLACNVALWLRLDFTHLRARPPLRPSSQRAVTCRGKAAGIWSKRLWRNFPINLPSAAFQISRNVQPAAFGDYSSAPPTARTGQSAESRSTRNTEYKNRAWA